MRVAIVDDSDAIAGHIANVVKDVCPGAEIEVLEYITDLTGRRFDMALVDISAVGFEGEELRHSHNRIGQFMRENYACRVVITTRMAEIFVRETREEIEAVAERPVEMLRSLDRKDIEALFRVEN